MSFYDRKDAGKQLVSKLMHFKGAKETCVIGLPRGGVVVAFEVAQALNLPLDIIAPRKIGSPYNEELALGAVTHTGEGYFNEAIIRSMHLPENFLSAAVQREKKISYERLQRYRMKKEPLDVANKTIIIVDDGLATGATMKAAIQSIRKQHAKKIIVAVPVSPTDTAREISLMADELYSLIITPHFYAVGQFYQNFGQTSDDEVIQLMRHSQ